MFLNILVSSQYHPFIEGGLCVLSGLSHLSRLPGLRHLREKLKLGIEKKFRDFKQDLDLVAHTADSLDVAGAAASCHLRRRGNVARGDIKDFAHLAGRNGLLNTRYTCADVWTGRWYMFMDGYNLGNTITRDGLVYDNNTQTWSNMGFTNAPWQREGCGAVWTGTEMIVWGGNTYAGNVASNKASSNTGGRYNPATNTWATMSTTGAPMARHRFLHAWTGTEYLVFGGCQNSLSVAIDCSLGSSTGGGRYNPATDTWTAMSTTNAPAIQLLGGRHVGIYATFNFSNLATSAWTGSKWVIIANNGTAFVR
jgi:hypothetical protein